MGRVDGAATRPHASNLTFPVTALVIELPSALPEKRDELEVCPDSDPFPRTLTPIRVDSDPFLTHPYPR